MANQGDGVAYATMLVEVSKHISDDELESMKYICKQFVGRRELEKITNFYKLCDALESHGKLEKQNLEFLKELLTKCTNGKIDAIKVVQQYEGQQLGGQIQAPYQVSNHVGAPTPTHVLVPGYGNVPERGLKDAELALKDMEKEVNYLTRKLGREWRFFMRSLGVSDYDMNATDQMYPRSLRDQIYASLLTWATQEKGRINKNMLIKALQDPSVERFDLAANIQEGDLN